VLGSAAPSAAGRKVTALAAHTPEAVRAASWPAAGTPSPPGSSPPACNPSRPLEDITDAEREALVHWGVKAGADVLTGDGWGLVVAAASRLAPLARPDRVPPASSASVRPRPLARGARGAAKAWRSPASGWRSTSRHHRIINVTPDSSRTARFVAVDRAIAQAERLIADGCELLDVGGDPRGRGATVAVDDEIARVVP